MKIFFCPFLQKMYTNLSLWWWYKCIVVLTCYAFQKVPINETWNITNYILWEEISMWIKPMKKGPFIEKAFDCQVMLGTFYFSLLFRTTKRILMNLWGISCKIVKKYFQKITTYYADVRILEPQPLLLIFFFYIFFNV